MPANLGYRALERGSLYLGAHVPVSGGLCNAPANGVAIGAEAIQIFTRNQMQWRCRPLSEDECGAFREALAVKRRAFGAVPRPTS